MTFSARSALSKSLCNTAPHRVGLVTNVAKRQKNDRSYAKRF